MREKKPKESEAEIVWMKGMHEIVEKKSEKELKFKDVIILDDIKNIKKQEEFIQANKMLLELDNINNDDEIEESKEQQIEFNQNDINSAMREYNEITDSETNSISDTQITESDNSIIEQLRIQLETDLGLDLLKSLYKLVESNVSLLI
jgi:hypothetical protein